MLGSLPLVGIVLAGNIASTECETCQKVILVEACTAVAYKTTILNCNEIISASGAGSGAAVRNYFDYSSLLPSCPPHEGPADVTLDSGVLDGPTAGSGVMVDRFLSFGGSSSDPGDPCGTSFGFTADLRTGNMQPCHISGSVQGYYTYVSAEVSSTITGTDLGDSVYLEMGSSGFGSSLEIETSDGLETETEVSVTASVSFETEDSCTENASSPSSPKYAGEQVDWVLSNGVEEFSVSGVLGVGTDGSVVLLGAFDDPGIVVATAAGSVSISGSYVISYDFGSAGTLVSESSKSTFGDLAGDFDDDLLITEDDRAAADAALGLSVGDAGYIAAVDFNLDGTVSANEVVEAYEILDYLLGTCRPDVAAPYGTLNFFDINAFTAWHTAGDPAADWNRDGTVNFFDMSDYIADYNAGCP